MHDRTTDCDCTDDARRELFTQKHRSLDYPPPTSDVCTFTSYGLYTWPHTSGVRHFSKTLRFLILLNGDGKRIKISQTNGSLYGQHSQNYQKHVKSSQSVGVILIWDVLGDVNVVKLCFHVSHSASVADFVKSLCNLWKYT